MKGTAKETVQSGAAAPKILALLVIAILVAGAFWMFSQQRETQPEKTIAPAIIETHKPVTAIPDVVEQAPDIPEFIAEEMEPEATQPAQVLPPLEESDAFVREILGSLSQDTEFALWIQTDNLIQKAAAIIDGLSRGDVLRKIIPIQPPEKPFQVVRQDGNIYLDEANFQRFDSLINTLTSISPAALAQAFQILRPLLEEAFSGLGNPGDKVDNSLVAAIDLTLASPEINGPIALKQESVIYHFADPELEALPQLHKQLIRLGPDNRQKLQIYLQQVRTALLEGSR